MKVDIMECSVVRPAQDTPNQHLWLSSLDLLVPRIHVRTVYLYKSDGSSDFFDARVLKEAMSKVLVPFYPVAGRLGTDESGRTQIHCNGEGVLFIQARTDLTSDDFGDFTPDSDDLKHLTPHVDYSGNISSYPLLVLQVTSLKCGGVCLGVGWLHTVLDGTCAIHFLNTWSDVARGLSISTSPFLDRTILQARDPPTHTFNHTEHHKPPSMNTPQPNKKATTSTAVFKISVDELDILKSKARDTSSTIRFSTFEVLSAHIWRCICKARDLPDDQATALYISTDGRGRLRPALPPAYLGNALFGNNVIALSGDVQRKALAYPARRVQEAIKRRDDEYLRSNLDYLQVQPDLAALRRGAHTYACPNLNISSWMRMPLYDADFGWGRPVHAGLACVGYEGYVFILPCPAKDKSFSVALCLDTHHMKRFQRCFYEF